VEAIWKQTENIDERVREMRSAGESAPDLAGDYLPVDKKACQPDA